MRIVEEREQRSRRLSETSETGYYPEHSALSPSLNNWKSLIMWQMQKPLVSHTLLSTTETNQNISSIRKSQAQQYIQSTPDHKSKLLSLGTGKEHIGRIQSLILLCQKILCFCVFAFLWYFFLILIVYLPFLLFILVCVYGRYLYCKN